MLPVHLLHGLAHQVLQHLLLRLGEQRGQGRGPAGQLRLLKRTFEILIVYSNPAIFTCIQL